ncbi:MAG: hypothetical protein AAFQ07_17460 [Chloroflexota bacterium]
MTQNITRTMRASIIVLIALLVVILAVATAQDVTPTPSDYVDLQFTEIRGLSTEQIEGYQIGAGLGFALPAELNGYPGPRHVLDLAVDLELTSTQQVAIQALYDDMLPQAIELGEQILAQEEAIELAFRDGTVTDIFLQESLAEAGRLESELRYVHLSTHLATIDILTEHQVRQYNVLRGYDAESDHSGHSGH